MERGSSPDEPYRMDRNMLSPFARDSSPSDGEAPWQSDEEDLFAEGAGVGPEPGARQQTGQAAGAGSLPASPGSEHPARAALAPGDDAGARRGGQRARRLWMGAGPSAGEALEQEVLRLDSKYRELVRQGRLVDASEHLEQSLFTRSKMFGADSLEVEKAARALVTHYNTAGMMSLQAGNFKLAFQLLRKAEILTGKNGPLHASAERRRLRAVSLNNMGCFYRRRKKQHAALRCLEQALEIELNLADAPISPAGTHLNICAVLSELKHHEAALVHANAALSLLLPLYGDASGAHDTSIFSDGGLAVIAASSRVAGANDSFSSAGAGDGEFGSGPSMLAAAFHNAAAQLESLKDLSAAAVTYQRAAVCAMHVWGSESAKFLVMKRAAAECRAKFLVKNPTAPDPFGRQVMRGLGSGGRTPGLGWGLQTGEGGVSGGVQKKSRTGPPAGLPANLPGIKGAPAGAGGGGRRSGYQGLEPGDPMGWGGLEEREEIGEPRRGTGDTWAAAEESDELSFQARKGPQTPPGLGQSRKRRGPGKYFSGGRGRSGAVSAMAGYVDFDESASGGGSPPRPWEVGYGGKGGARVHGGSLPVVRDAIQVLNPKPYALNPKP